ncbi:hypothetical protein BCD67_00095 [Oscillatoriales cyanobacterium USR001]|nr:hypothetical protein BCD67_00095 [Oscillatoriales cyanobacterium USR001]
MIKALSILVIWFPIIKEVISRQIQAGTQLIIALDRTQWKEYNVLMVSAIYQKRAFPIFWTLLDKQGASNLAEQQQVLRPVIRLSVDNLEPLASSKSKGARGASSTFLYTIANGDAKVLTYFTCFSCTILSICDRITQTASPPGTDSASPK